MTKEEYVACYMAELTKAVNIGDRNARHCAEAAYEDDPEGDPVEAAQSEADEWLRSS